VLQVAQVTAYAGGTKIVIFGHNGAQRTLNVAEACAGLRSLMTFVSVGAALAFLLWAFRPLWQKLLITASAIPIAIFCNVMRVSGQGLLDRYVSQELSESFAHQFVGLIMMIPAFFLLLGVGWLLDRVLLQEVDDRVVLSRGVVRRSRAAKIAPPPPVRTLAPRGTAGPSSSTMAAKIAAPPAMSAAPKPADRRPGQGAGPANDPVARPSPAVATAAVETPTESSDADALPQSTPLPQITPGPARPARMPPRAPLAPGRQPTRTPGAPRVPGAFVPPQLPTRPGAAVSKPAPPEGTP
jgi:exosortase/archaeosortase family protein